MLQTVVELSNIAREWIMLTLTALNREYGGLKTTSWRRLAGDAGEGAAEVEGNDVTRGTVVPEAIVEIAGGDPADVAAGVPGSYSIPNCVRCEVETVTWVRVEPITAQPSCFHLRAAGSQ